MALFLPTVAVENVTDITPELIVSMGARAIILDVDNTLATHGSPVPFAGSVEWAHAMRKAGIKVVIMSNNVKERVAPFAEKYELPFLCMALKPLPFAYWRAARFLGVPLREAVAVGDQVFTDILGANLAFMKSILLVPPDPESSLSFRVRRRLEVPIRHRAAQRQQKTVDRRNKK